MIPKPEQQVDVLDEKVWAAWVEKGRLQEKQRATTMNRVALVVTTAVVIGGAVYYYLGR